MPRNRHAVHANLNIPSGVEVSGWGIGFLRPTINPNRVREIWRLDRRNDIGEFLKELALGTEAFLVTISVAPPIQAIASHIHFVAVPRPGIVRGSPRQIIPRRRFP